MKYLIVLLSVLFMVGCASRWEHASKQPSEYYGDDRECQSLTGGASRGIEPGSERMSYESCMWERGWRKKQSIWFFDPPYN